MTIIKSTCNYMYKYTYKQIYKKLYIYMYALREQQQKEIAAVKPWTITLNLSDAECERIAKEAGKATEQGGRYFRCYCVA